MFQIEHNSDKSHSTDVAHLEAKRDQKNSQEKLSSHAESAYKLKNLVDTIEKYEAQKSAITEAIKATYDAASSYGYDKKALKQAVTDRQKDQQELDIFNNTVSDLKTLLTWAEENPRWKKAI